uniref:Methyltransferase like 22 n=1 Tax=Tetraodon nigroviridis TaxID=99883 RepID=H3C9Y6_TETNG
CQTPMDDFTSQYDTVLSDVHLLRPAGRHLVTRLNGAGQPVFRSRFRFLPDRDGSAPGSGPERPEDAADTPEHTGQDVDPVLDEDGDLEVSHRPRTEPEHQVISPIILHQSDSGPEQQDADGDASAADAITIEHTMATPLGDVGKQIWRAALLLADFILSEPGRFAGATVLELGAGTGVSSIVMATAAKTVYCTDVGADLLRMCSRNVTLNQHLTRGEVRVRHLDWLRPDLRTDAGVFSWTQEEEEHLYAHTSAIVAADVCYDDRLTDAFFRTVSRLCSRFGRLCSIYVSIEKRMNFSLRRLGVACEAYDHFRRCVSRLRAGPSSFSAQRLRTGFPQALRYERVQQLELWEITARPGS